VDAVAVMSNELLDAFAEDNEQAGTRPWKQTPDRRLHLVPDREPTQDTVDVDPIGHHIETNGNCYPDDTGPFRKFGKGLVRC
jgi:hypothetical protein